MMVAVTIIEKHIHPARQYAGRIGHPNRPPESRAQLGFEPQPGLALWDGPSRDAQHAATRRVGRMAGREPSHGAGGPVERRVTELV